MYGSGTQRGMLPDDPRWPDRLARALTLLREHIFKEQDGVFPAALATLRTADWEKVDAARLTAPSATAGDSWHPRPAAGQAGTSR